MLDNQSTLCEGSLACKHDENEHQIGITAKETRIARSVLKRVAIEIKYMILERTPLPWLADVINDNDSKYLEKVKKACNDNAVEVIPLNDSSWIVEFRKFISSMKNIPNCEQCSQRFLKGDIELGGTRIKYHTMNNVIGGVQRDFEVAVFKFSFTFLKRKRGLRDQGIILEHSNIQTYGMRFSARLQLTNRNSTHCQRIQQAEEFKSTENFAQIQYPSMVACDDNGYVYYYVVDQRNRRIKICRIDLYTNNSKHQNVCFIEGHRITPFVVGNKVLFLIHDNHVMSCDLTTLKQRRINTPARGRGYISAHNKSVFFTTKDSRACICSLKDGQLVAQSIRFSRLLSFNRHSYFVWDNNHVNGRTQLMILSIVNDELILQLVQSCDDDSEVRRLSDNFFYMTTKGEHRLWFQEEHGAKPCLVHVVDQP